MLALVAALTWSERWPAVFEWFGAIGIVGVFTIVLGLAAGLRRSAGTS